MLIRLLMFAIVILAGPGPHAQEWRAMGSMAKDDPAISFTYLSSDEKIFIVSFITQESRIGRNQLPTPSVFVVNCETRSYQGNGVFKRKRNEYVKGLIEEFCTVVSRSRLEKKRTRALNIDA